MTEFGDRIKTLRTQNRWSGPDAAVKIFPRTHADTSKAARATFVSNIENGRQVMQESSPDFGHVAKFFACSEADLLKMIYQGQKEIRATKSKTAKAVVVPMPDVPAPAHPGPSTPGPASRRLLRDRPKKVTNGTHTVAPAKTSQPVNARAELGLDGIAGDLTAMFQKTSQSSAIRGIHHDVLSTFVRRVVSAACKVQGSLS